MTAGLVRKWLPVAAAASVTLVIVGIAYEQSGSLSRTGSFYTSFAITAALLAVLSLALNIQWGYTGVFNFGVAGFFMVGAYTGAIVVKEPDNTPYADYIGGYGPDLNIIPALETGQWLPFIVGIFAAGAVCGILAFILAIPTLRLREDYLAITTIGVAELLRRIAIEERWLANGTRVLGNIPQPLSALSSKGDYQYVFLPLALAFLLVAYLVLERSVRSPWGRVLRAVREDEVSARGSGKNAFVFKTQAFVVGGVVMGMGGAMYGYEARAISPETFTHFFGTFLIWTMLIVGGSGNNRGAILGAYVIWGFWQSMSLVQSYDLPELVATRVSFLRDIGIGLLIVLVLLLMPKGLLPEQRDVSTWVERRVRRSARARDAPGPAPPE